MASAPRRRRPHAAHEEEHENHERWLVTYADMITLLMVLFIVMFAVSQVDAKKFQALHEGLAQSFRHGNPAIEGGDGLLDATRQHSAPAVDADAATKALELVKQQATAMQRDRSALEQARRDLQAALAQRGAADMVRFRVDERGLTVSIITDQVLFPLGSADLQPQGRGVLDAVAPVLRRLPNRITVEGHTDDLPITGRFPSNWELSAERATSVLRYLLQQHRLVPGRLSAAGYADQRPVAANTDDRTRQRNRRVEIVVLSTLTNPAAPGVVPDKEPL